MKTLILPTLVLFGLPAIGSAATISYLGNVEGTEVTDWRTTTTTKSLDIDGDDFYGTHGAVHWLRAGVNQQPLDSTTPGWGYVGGGAQYNNAPYVAIDHVSTYPTDTTAGIVVSNFTFELTGDAGTYAGQTVRVGVMHDVLGPTEWASDHHKGLQIVQTVGGTGDSTAIALRAGNAGDGAPEMYFFDMAGVSAGDRFEIRGLRDIGGASANAGYIGPVSWDLVPEPSTGILAGLAALALLRRRRG